MTVKGGRVECGGRGIEQKGQRIHGHGQQCVIEGGRGYKGTKW